jgi:hypothetical protein
MKVLPPMPNIEILNCKLCCYLKALPFIPKVQYFNGRGTNIKKLQDMPDIRILKLHGTGIEELPFMPKIVSLRLPFSMKKYYYYRSKYFVASEY